VQVNPIRLSRFTFYPEAPRADGGPEVDAMEVRCAFYRTTRRSRLASVAGGATGAQQIAKHFF
jgi:hypothetical protein